MIDIVFIIFAVVLTASSGAAFKPGDWYFSLKKPSWTPPNWAFPVVWTVLYAMIGYAGYLIVQAAGWGIVMAVWVLQLVFNAAWSWLFFGKRRMDLAFVDVCLLWVSVALLIGLAWPVSSLAAVLLIPYLVWIVIAATLNRTVWQMNLHEAPN